MLDKLLLIKCIKMRGHRLGKNRAHLLSVHLGSALKLEALVSLHIGRLTLESVRLVLREAYHRGAVVADGLQHFVVFSQFSLLLLGEILLVRRLTFEWQRVEWVLWVLLMENVVLTIFPVGEVFLVGRLAYDGFFLVVSLFY